MSDTAEEVKGAEVRVRGNSVHLSEGRKVFLGRTKDDANVFYIGFKNKKGIITRLCLSDEAIAALVKLYDQRDGEWIEVFPDWETELVWKVRHD